MSGEVGAGRGGCGRGDGGSASRGTRPNSVGGAQWARARSAYCEHEAHVFDVGRVPAQWLVKRCLDLPSQKGGVRCGAGCAGRGVRARRGGSWVGVGWWKSACRGGGAGRKAGGTRAVCGHGRCYVEHPFHVCDAGGVKAQRLVESTRTLPRVERGIYAVRGESCESGEVSKSLGGGSASKRTVRLQLGRSGHGSCAPRTCRTWL